MGGAMTWDEFVPSWNFLGNLGNGGSFDGPDC
jgi:hypothetical protein